MEKKARRSSFFSCGKLFKLMLFLLVAAIAVDIYKHKGYKGTVCYDSVNVACLFHLSLLRRSFPQSLLIFVRIHFHSMHLDIPTHLGHVYTLPDTSCVGTKNISDRAFVHTQNADFGSILSRSDAALLS